MNETNKKTLCCEVEQVIKGKPTGCHEEKPLVTRKNHGCYYGNK